jgi:predicted DNA-binding ribbon-helix-helix protein
VAGGGHSQNKSKYNLFFLHVSGAPKQNKYFFEILVETLQYTKNFGKEEIGNLTCELRICVLLYDICLVRQLLPTFYVKLHILWPVFCPNSNWLVKFLN